MFFFSTKKKKELSVATVVLIDIYKKDVICIDI
jgi:hypothetical protein